MLALQRCPCLPACRRILSTRLQHKSGVHWGSVGSWAQQPHFKILWIRLTQKLAKTLIMKVLMGARIEEDLPREGHRKLHEWMNTRCPAVLCREVWFFSDHLPSESQLVSSKDSGKVEWHKRMEKFLPTTSKYQKVRFLRKWILLSFYGFPGPLKLSHWIK